MKFLIVIHSKTKKVVKTVDITGKSDRQVDKLDCGLSRNMSLEYRTQVVTKEQLDSMEQE